MVSVLNEGKECTLDIFYKTELFTFINYHAFFIIHVLSCQEAFVKLKMWLPYYADNNEVNKIFKNSLLCQGSYIGLKTI